MLDFLFELLLLVQFKQRFNPRIVKEDTYHLINIILVKFLVAFICLLLNYFANHSDSHGDVIEVRKQPLHEAIDQLHEISDVLIYHSFDFLELVDLEVFWITRIMENQIHVHWK